MKDYKRYTALKRYKNLFIFMSWLSPFIFDNNGVFQSSYSNNEHSERFYLILFHEMKIAQSIQIYYLFQNFTNFLALHLFIKYHFKFNLYFVVKF